ncbi:glycosyl transferase family 1 [Bacteroidia bacterium]|nr:glycosyl transferase family 1 [Bacteroidia bacterium]
MSTGGIESHVLAFCEKISSPYVVIDIVVANFKMRKNEADILKKYCRKVYFIQSNSPLTRHFILLKTLFLLQQTKYDVLYTNGSGGSILLVGKLIRHKQWVLHHHMEFDDKAFAAIDKQYKKALVLADNVIACSNINAKNMFMYLNRPIDVVYCFSRNIGQSIENRELGNQLHFGYFGRLIPAKGIDLICKLSDDSDCKDITFHLWGEGIEYPASFFEQYPNMQYHGVFSTAKELQQITSMLDAFLLLTTHPEGLPISLLEVMSAGVPWLSTNVGGIPDIVCDPLSTRLLDIKDISNYEKIKASVLRLAADIRAGIVLKEKQKFFYNVNFSAEILISVWKTMMNI